MLAKILRQIGAGQLAFLGFIDADGFDPLELSVLEAPIHKPLHGSIHRLPTRCERPGCLSPRQTSRPGCQKAHHRHRHGSLANAPGHLLNNDSILRTVHSAHRIEQYGRDSPQRHEIPGTRRQLVIARAGFEAAATLSLPSLMRLNCDFDPTGVVAQPTWPQAVVLVDETGQRLYSVQKGFNFEANSWSPGSFFQPVRSLTGRPKAGYSFAFLSLLQRGMAVLRGLPQPAKTSTGACFEPTARDPVRSDLPLTPIGAFSLPASICLHCVATNSAIEPVWVYHPHPTATIIA